MRRKIKILRKKIQKTTEDISEIGSCIYPDEQGLLNAYPDIIRFLYPKAQTPKWWAKIDHETQQVLKTRFQELSLDHNFPYHPTKPKEVQGLSEKWIRAYYEDYRSTLFSDEVNKAFFLRFFEFDLRLPGTSYSKKWTPEQLKLFSQIELDISTTDVASLELYQKEWLFAACYQNEKWDQLSLQQQIKIYSKCFQKNAGFELEFALPTSFDFCKSPGFFDSDVQKQFYKQFQDTAIWKKIPLDLQVNFNERFNSVALFAKTLPHLLDPSTLPDNPSKLNLSRTIAYNQVFKKNATIWDQLSREQQQSFDTAFKAHYEDLLPIKDPVAPQSGEFFSRFKWG